MNVNNYTDYFRQMAVKHKDLRHDPASETGDAPIGSKHFGRFGSEEVITGLKSKVDWPALLVEMYEWKSKSEQAYSVVGDYAGGFSVYATANPENLNEVQEAFTFTESIMQDVLAKIWQDHYGPDKDMCNSPFKLFDFNSLEVMPVGPVFDRQFGWRCTFSFIFNNLKKITTAPEPGTFI
ncbi:hypothetical protein ACFOWM_03395 [Ferruginibacter yonginensis]|uniref:Uncharacterized protein n=1 Tax=Ferruginibacter yonginensis TaxID=1310416 RepID=A0ABV8QQD6_9BACT